MPLLVKWNLQLGDAALLLRPPFCAESTEFALFVLPPRPEFDLDRARHSPRDQVMDSIRATDDFGLPGHFWFKQQGVIIDLGGHADGPVCDVGRA